MQTIIRQAFTEPCRIARAKYNIVSDTKKVCCDNQAVSAVNSSPLAGKRLERWSIEYEIVKTAFEATTIDNMLVIFFLWRPTIFLSKTVPMLKNHNK